MSRSVVAAASGLRRSLHRIWRPQSTRILVAGISLFVLVGLGELVFTLTRPCLMSSRMYSAECGDSVFWLTVVLLLAKVAAMVAITVIQTQGKVNYAVSRQLPELLGKQAAEGPSGWAAASSEDIFEGIVQATASSQAHLLWWQLFSVVVPAAAFAAADLAATRSPEYQEFLAETCTVDSRWWDPCRIAWTFKEVIGLSIGTSASYIEAMMALMRLEMLGPVFGEIVRKKQMRWLHRCLRLHWFQGPARMCNMVTLAIGIRVKIMAAGRLEMAAFTWIAAAYFVYLSAIIAWSLDLDGMMSRCLARVLLPRGVVPAPSGDEESPDTVELRNGGEIVAKKTSGRADVSFTHRLTQMLFGSMIVTALVPFGSWATVAVVWIVRVVSLGLVLTVEDAPCTFSELQNKGAAFGLLVHADGLREAIRAYLSSSVYIGRLHTTRASYYRMEDTMAVSYRWNSREVEICHGLCLNMSAWQLRELEMGIRGSGCSYVWIDRLALPQRPCQLQNTLLARMMTIYATSKLTLALRSMETDKNRYHQRAWTLQEYCTAQDLRVVTQPRPAGAGTELQAVVGDEEEFFSSLRTWHQARQATCRPYWLGGLALERGGDDQRQAMNKFLELSPRVECQEAADKIRAMYPMFFNTPCDGQVELTGLVSEVGGQLDRRHSITATLKESIAADQEIMAAMAEGGFLSHFTTRLLGHSGPGIGEELPAISDEVPTSDIDRLLNRSSRSTGSQISFGANANDDGVTEIQRAWAE